MMYIKGIGQVSPFVMGNTPSGGEAVLRAVEPDYSQFVDVRQLRRMARIIKMSVAASAIAMKDAGIEQPDAIITATGLGCIEDTQDFLKSVVVNKETLLSPTAFIKSTHNTIGGQIALMRNSNGYNMTYAHRNFSWESALLDAQLLLAEKEATTVLAGGIDELTEQSIHLLQRLGCIRKDATGNLPQGGEGAVFMLLTDKEDAANYAVIEKVAFSYEEDTNRLFTSFFSNTGIAASDIDVVLTGAYSEADYRNSYRADIEKYFPAATTGHYKHLCGECHTSSAFATWLGAVMLKEQKALDGVFFDSEKAAFNNILVYNRSAGNAHSLILLRKC